MWIDLLPWRKKRKLAYIAFIYVALIATCISIHQVSIATHNSLQNKNKIIKKQNLLLINKTKKIRKSYKIESCNEVVRIYKTKTTINNKIILENKIKKLISSLSVITPNTISLQSLTINRDNLEIKSIASNITDAHKYIDSLSKINILHSIVLADIQAQEYKNSINQKKHIYQVSITATTSKAH